VPNQLNFQVTAFQNELPEQYQPTASLK